MTDNSHTFAGRDGKIELFKFRPFGTWKERFRVRQIVLGHKIYFARARELNDPFDLSPRLETVTREALLRGGNEYWDRRPDAPAEHREKQLKYLATCDLASHRADAQRRMRETVEKNRVFSLAGNRDHPLLWSHYASGHTGLCVHFYCKGDTLFGGSMKVDYVKERKLVPVEVNSVPPHDLFQLVAMHKPTFWDYEEEYRWIKFADTDYSGIPIKFNGPVATFPPSAITGITVGARMPQRNVAKVLKMAAKHVPALTVWRAVETDTYAFDFEKIA